MFVWMNGGWIDGRINVGICTRNKVLDGYFISRFFIQPYRLIIIEQVSTSSESGEVERLLPSSSSLTGRGSWLYVGSSIKIELAHEECAGHYHLHVYWHALASAMHF